MKAALLFLVCSLAIADEAKEPMITVPVERLQMLLESNDRLRAATVRALDERNEALKELKTCKDSRST